MFIWFKLSVLETARKFKVPSLTPIYEENWLDDIATDAEPKRVEAIWLYNPKSRKWLSSKLQRKGEGSYTIIQRINDLTYRWLLIKLI